MIKLIKNEPMLGEVLGLLNSLFIVSVLELVFVGVHQNFIKSVLFFIVQPFFREKIMKVIGAIYFMEKEDCKGTSLFLHMFD